MYAMRDRSPRVLLPSGEGAQDFSAEGLGYSDHQAHPQQKHQQSFPVQRKGRQSSMDSRGMVLPLQELHHGVDGDTPGLPLAAASSGGGGPLPSDKPPISRHRRMASVDHAYGFLTGAGEDSRSSQSRASPPGGAAPGGNSSGLGLAGPVMPRLRAGLPFAGRNSRPRRQAQQQQQQQQQQQMYFPEQAGERSDTLERLTRAMGRGRREARPVQEGEEEEEGLMVEGMVPRTMSVGHLHFVHRSHGDASSPYLATQSPAYSRSTSVRGGGSSSHHSPPLAPLASKGEPNEAASASAGGALRSTQSQSPSQKKGQGRQQQEQQHLGPAHLLGSISPRSSSSSTSSSSQQAPPPKPSSRPNLRTRRFSLTDKEFEPLSVDVSSSAAVEGEEQKRLHGLLSHQPNQQQDLSPDFSLSVARAQSDVSSASSPGAFSLSSTIGHGPRGVSPPDDLRLPKASHLPPTSPPSDNRAVLQAQSATHRRRASFQGGSGSGSGSGAVAGEGLIAPRDVPFTSPAKGPGPGLPRTSKVSTFGAGSRSGRHANLGNVGGLSTVREGAPGPGLSPQGPEESLGRPQHAFRTGPGDSLPIPVGLPVPIPTGAGGGAGARIPVPPGGVGGARAPQGQGPRHRRIRSEGFMPFSFDAALASMPKAQAEVPGVAWGVGKATGGLPADEMPSNASSASANGKGAASHYYTGNPFGSQHRQGAQSERGNLAATMPVGSSHRGIPSEQSLLSLVEGPGASSSVLRQAQAGHKNSKAPLGSLGADPSATVPEELLRGALPLFSPNGNTLQALREPLALLGPTSSEGQAQPFSLQGFNSASLAFLESLAHPSEQQQQEEEAVSASSLRAQLRSLRLAAVPSSPSGSPYSHSPLPRSPHGSHSSPPNGLGSPPLGTTGSNSSPRYSGSPVQAGESSPQAGSNLSQLSSPGYAVLDPEKLWDLQSFQGQRLTPSVTPTHSPRMGALMSPGPSLGGRAPIRTPNVSDYYSSAKFRQDLIMPALGDWEAQTEAWGEGAAVEGLSHEKVELRLSSGSQQLQVQEAQAEVEGELAALAHPKSHQGPGLSQDLSVPTAMRKEVPSGLEHGGWGAEAAGLGAGHEGLGYEAEVGTQRKPSDANVLGRPFRRIQEHYNLSSKELGRGNFGVIRVCESLETGERFACKTIDKKTLECWEDVEDVQREVQVMEVLRSHPNVVRLADTMEDAQAVHLVMELCEGGELFDRIQEKGYYSESKASRVCRTMVEVLGHCHRHNILHRDLKPENILLSSKKSDTRIKVIDYGMAYIFKPGERCTFRAGTPNYIAPEVINKNYGPEADIWSAGVILYIMLCGLPPFWGDTTEEIFKSVLLGHLDFETEPWPQVSNAAKDLVRRMLQKNYAKRITVEEILKHPWIVAYTT